MLNKNESELIHSYVKKIKSVEYLGSKCKNCNENDIFKLSFHHRIPNEKNYEWDILKNKRWSEIIIELDKCDLLCYNCHSEYHYLENEKYISVDSINRRLDKIKILKLKDNVECVECGYDKCVASLEFHHRDREYKRFMLGKKRVNNLTHEILNEINKCDIVCKNCHVKKHTNIKLYHDNLTLIEEKIKNYKEYSKLNENEVYKLFLEGNGIIQISKIYKVNKSTISTIVKRIKNRE